MEDVTRVGIGLRNFSLMTGVSRVVGELVRRLPARGFEAVVAARKGPVEPLPGCRVERALMWPFSSTIRAATFDWSARRRLRAAGAALIHGHGDLTRQDVLSVHNCDAAAARHVPDGRRPSGGVRYVRDRQFKDCAVVIADSKMVARDLTEFYGVPPEKIETVYYGVDLERFHPARRAAARAALLARGGWRPETFVVLSVMSGDPSKRNFGFMTRTVEALASGVDAAYCVVGNVAWEADPAARRLKAAGRFLHVPPTPAVQDCFAAADAFFLAAHYEEFGLTVLEALASGTPAVVSARCGAAEVLTPGADGFVFSDVSDLGEALAALRRLAASPLPPGGPRAAAERYTWDRHADEVVRIYRRLRP